MRHSITASTVTEGLGASHPHPFYKANVPIGEGQGLSECESASPRHAYSDCPLG
jgi:hypothetical protein